MHTQWGLWKGSANGWEFLSICGSQQFSAFILHSIPYPLTMDHSAFINNFSQFCLFVFWTWLSRRFNHVAYICHNKDQKVWHKDLPIQDIYLRLLVKLYGFLAKRTNSTFNQVVDWSCVEEVVHESYQPAPRFLSWMIQKMKLPGQKDRTVVVWGTVTNVCGRRCPNWRCVHCVWAVMTVATSTKLGARSSYLTSWPGLSQGLWHRLTLWSMKVPTGIGVYWQGSRDPTQPHQTLCAIQELKAGTGQMQQGQHQLQKVTPDPALLLKRFWCWKKNFFLANFLSFFFFSSLPYFL